MPMQEMTPIRTPMDPALRAFLDELAANTPPLPPQPTALERAALGRAGMERALAGRTEIAGLPNDVQSRDIMLTPTLQARLFTPAAAAMGEAESARGLPAVIYLHGGGWVIGSLATHTPFCSLLAAKAGVLVLSVDYRLAPEHRYPAALEDTITAYQWAAAHAAEIGGDASRLVLAGDSAGGNLAAAAANQLAAEHRADALVAQLLLYPVTDGPTAHYPSRAENARGCGLELAGMEWFWEQYAGHVSPQEPGAFPLHHTPLPKLPPTFVTTAGYDVLRDEGIAYAEKLRLAGVAVTHHHAADMHHNFPISPGTVQRFPQCVAEMDAIAAWLRAAVASR